MNINILRYSLFGIAGGQEVDHILLDTFMFCGSSLLQTKIY